MKFKILPQKRDPAKCGENSKFKSVIYALFICFLLFNLIGCEALVRKFTRKPKRKKLPQEEMVIAPQSYRGPAMTKEDVYRQYFLYWRSWQDELIESLSVGGNYKKQKDCVNETIKNLEIMRRLLNEEKKEKLDIYINQLKKLFESVTKDIYGDNITGNRLTAERIKRNILQDFSYNKIQDSLL